MTALIAFSLVLPAPAAAQFGGGKPKIPEATMLSSYDTVISTEALTIAPVKAGLSSTAAYSDAELQSLGLNPLAYSQTLQHLQQVVAAIARDGPRPDIIPAVRLELSDRPDAFAANQETIVLTTELLNGIYIKQQDPQDAQSAIWFVLAHEYAHILYDHPRRFAEKDKKSQISKYFGTALLFATQMQKYTTQIDPAMGEGTKELVGKMSVATAISPFLERELYRVGFAPYKKQEESFADFMGSDLLQGFEAIDPRVGAGFLETFEQYDNSIFGQMKAGVKYFEAEMDVVSKQVADNAVSGLNNADFSNFGNVAKKSLVDGGIRFLAGILSRRYNKDKVHLYYSAEKRVEGIRAYLDKFHQPHEELADDALLLFAKQNKVATAEAAQAAYVTESKFDNAARDAKFALARGDAAEARRLIDAVGKKTGAKTANFFLIDGLVYQAQGDFIAAEKSLELAIKQPDARYDSYAALSTVEVNQGKLDQALATLNLAETKFGVERVILAKINLLVAQQKIDEAKVLAQTCQVYEALQKDCLAAIPPPPEAEAEDAEDDE